jgi:hypothetical protein
MARETKKQREPKVYLIQKTVHAHSLAEALKKESKGQIVEVTLTNAGVKKLEPAIGFVYRPDGPVEEEEK